jgi:hypothetical protein
MSGVSVSNSPEVEPIELYDLMMSLLDFDWHYLPDQTTLVCFRSGDVDKVGRRFCSGSSHDEGECEFDIRYPGFLVTFLSRKNGHQARICWYLKNKLILECIACGLPSLSYSPYVDIGCA